MTEIFSPTEIIGYLASLGVLVSYLMKDIKMLRILSILGCTLFVVYGILLAYSIPIILTNGIIIVINCYFLLKKKSNNK